MMTYNDGTCAVQFPSHYVPVTEEEMTYVDGGWSASVFAKNIAGIWNKTTAARHALRGQGISWSYIASMATLSYNYIVANVAAKLFVAISTINFIAAAIVAAGAVYAVNYLGNNPNKFY